MGLSQPNVSLNEEQEAESQRIYERLRGAFDEELKTMARFMASKGNHAALRPNGVRAARSGA